jgi:NAD(P)-dependent dehydrogenase (short-subunit alcohol dehydrogenase family)
MTRPIAVISGTSSGVGFELALLLAKQGYLVYATMRNLAKQDALLAAASAQGLSENLRVRQIDVVCSSSVYAGINAILAEAGRIDLLINNAGAGFVRSLEQAQEEEIEWVTQTNYLSVVRMVKAVIPAMRQQQSGHIINVSSVGGLVGQPFNELYCGAKFAVEGFTEAMASYMSAGFNLRFTVIEPGGIKSEFAANALAQIEAGGGIFDDEYRGLLDKYLAGAATRTSSYQTAREVAEVIVSQAVLAKNPPLRLRTSQWAEDFTALKTQLDPDGLKIKHKVEQDFLV